MKAFTFFLVTLASLQVFAERNCNIRDNPNLSNEEVQNRRERCIRETTFGLDDIVGWFAGTPDEQEHVDMAAFNEAKSKLRAGDMDCNEGTNSSLNTMMSGRCGSAENYHKLSSRNGNDRYMCSNGGFDILIVNVGSSDDIKRISAGITANGTTKLIANCSE